MTELRWDEIDKRAVDTARVLAADAVEKVGNGHPGTAMSLAPAAYLLYQRVMKHDPADTHWPGRDRFILSCGHSSLTQYIQLYLGGFGLELDDLKSLRTWGSLTPGHPEYGHTKGVEITTGPLGQGLASSVGFAYAARYERGLFDPEAAPGQSPFDHHVFVIASDGDLQEGVTSEASSLAGHQQLGNLIAIYDANGRPELAAGERAESAVIESFMPAQMGEDEMKAAIGKESVSDWVEVTVMPGVRICRSLMSCTPAPSRTSCDRVVTTIGTSCRLCSRFWAVTMMSSRPS